MNNINKIDIVSSAYHEMSFTSLVYCNYSSLNAVSPENAPGEMYVIELESRYLHTESVWYHSDDDRREKAYLEDSSLPCRHSQSLH